MANGTTDEKLAKADRIREKSAKAQHKADQNRKATQNAIAELRRSQLQPYRAEMESEDSTVTGPGGITAKLPIPRAGRLAIGIGLGVLFICVGAAIVLRAWR